jgi:hypothetical protein
MRRKLLVTTFIVLTALSGCNNNGDQAAQPRIGEMDGNVNHGDKGMDVTNVTQRYDNPYNHNYNGDFTGAENSSVTNDIRSAQQTGARASEAAEKVAGVRRAVSVVQGMDIVIGIEADNSGDMQALEQKVKQAVSKSEQGYNVYVTGDEKLSERVRNLFTNMNNVKTSHVSPGIGEIIYDIGRMNGR